jgi:hypothetical protein
VLKGCWQILSFKLIRSKITTALSMQRVRDRPVVDGSHLSDHAVERA